jgi:gas vesicle protein
MSTRKLLLGVLAGVAAGALVGILFAPDKGTETRKKISKKGAGYTGELKDSFNEMVNVMSSKFNKTKEEASDLVEQGKSIVEQGKNKVNEFKREVKNTVM